jgi:hypothetical protein
MRIVGTSRISQSSPPLRRDGGTAPTVSDALVEVTPLRRTAPPAYSLSRPDPFFITQLLATAEQSPQTRALRRADVSDVEAAYRAVANQNAAVTGITRRMA